MEGGETGSTPRTFEDLKAWQASRQVRTFTAAFVRTLPAAEKRRLADQMLRAARSVTANIAEGYGRFHYQESIQYCRQARGSLYELLDHFICAADEGFASAEQLTELRMPAMRALGLLNGFINYLLSARDGGRSIHEDAPRYDTGVPASESDSPFSIPD